MRGRSTGPFILIAACLTSCATKQVELDLSEYPKLPSARIVDQTRIFIKKSDRLRELALWGNYGGPGCAGGPPIDQMDELFRQHDLSYLQGIKRRELIESDRLLMAQLDSLDAAELSPSAQAYRDRAIGYFSRPLSRVIGKPPNVIFGLKTRPAIIDTSASARTARASSGGK